MIAPRRPKKRRASTDWAHATATCDDGKAVPLDERASSNSVARLRNGPSGAAEGQRYRGPATGNTMYATKHATNVSSRANTAPSKSRLRLVSQRTAGTA